MILRCENSRYHRSLLSSGRNRNNISLDLWDNLHYLPVQGMMYTLLKYSLFLWNLILKIYFLCLFSKIRTIKTEKKLFSTLIYYLETGICREALCCLSLKGVRKETIWGRERVGFTWPFKSGHQTCIQPFFQTTFLFWMMILLQDDY